MARWRILFAILLSKKAEFIRETGN